MSLLRAAGRWAPRLVPLLSGCFVACGPSEERPRGPKSDASSARERLEVLVGRRGPVVFLVFPKAWGAGYGDAALAERARLLGVPAERALYEVAAVHTALAESGAEPFAFDPARVEIELTRRSDVVARASALAASQRRSEDAAREVVWRAWCGPSADLPPASTARWTYLLDAPEIPRGLEGAPVEGRLVWRGDATIEPIHLGVWRIEPAAFLRHLRAPSSELLRVAEIKNAFRSDARATRRG